MKMLMSFLLVVCACAVFSQDVPRYKPLRNRVLFLLDASGSMKEKWQSENRFEAAKKLLFNIIDSVERQNPNVEFAVRVFGHQFSREQRNCTDSKLLIPFAKNNSTKLKSVLPTLSPKGMTPIAYSIAQCANDFPSDPQSLNSIILITDGDENCGGNPCEAAALLSDRRITLKPFIVGLDISPELEKKFDCVGTFYNPKDEAALSGTVGIIIQQTLNTTTTQVNLLDHNAKPVVTNIPFTLYDHASQKVMYNFVHGLDAKGNPDTIFLDPVGVYDIEVHSTPPVRKNGIELTPGKHNIIAVDVPVGNLHFTGGSASDVSLVIRSSKSILATQSMSEEKMLLSGIYNAEATTLPETFFIKTGIASGTKNEITVKNAGTLSINLNEAIALTILEETSEKLTPVMRATIKEATTVRLQPGNYVLIYKTTKSTKTESTKSQKVTIEEGKYLSLSLK